jgi:hypothetical protein
MGGGLLAVKERIYFFFIRASVIDNVCSKFFKNFRFCKKEHNPPAYNLADCVIIPDEKGLSVFFANKHA